MPGTLHLKLCETQARSATPSANSASKQWTGIKSHGLLLESMVAARHGCNMHIHTCMHACMHAYVACVHSFVCTYMELRLDLHRYIPTAYVHARAHTDTNTKSHSLRENGCFGPLRTEPCTCGHPHLWSNISGTGVNECGFRSAKAGAICQACRVQCYTAEFGGTNLADIQILVTYW